MTTRRKLANIQGLASLEPHKKEEEEEENQKKKKKRKRKKKGSQNHVN